MANESAGVLIIGAGASGGVVARRLTEAGFRVVCLEQGGWHERPEYRGAGQVLARRPIWRDPSTGRRAEGS